MLRSDGEKPFELYASWLRGDCYRETSFEIFPKLPTRKRLRYEKSRNVIPTLVISGLGRPTCLVGDPLLTIDRALPDPALRFG